MYGLVVAFVRSVLRLDFLLQNELFLRLSCAPAPAFSTIPSERRSVRFFSFALVELNNLTGEVDEVEHLLYCGMVNLSFGDRLIFLCELNLLERNLSLKDVGSEKLSFILVFR